jgi:hypothetical protein
MEIYYIYEIPGIKVGCTENLKRRMQQQKVWDSKQYKVLGAANNINDATELEKEWQIKLGYNVDKGYGEMLKWQSKVDHSKIDYSNHTGKQMYTPEAIVKRKKIINDPEFIKAREEKRLASMDYSNRNMTWVHNVNWEEIKKKMVNNTDYKARSKKMKKPILMFKNKQFIREWESATDASKELNIGINCIYACLSFKSKTAGGYGWERKN